MPTPTLPPSLAVAEGAYLCVNRIPLCAIESASFPPVAVSCHHATLADALAVVQRLADVCTLDAIGCVSGPCPNQGVDR